MKNLIFVLLFLANSIIVNAQFNSRSYIANVLTPGKNHELRLGDVDNDNDLDYVSMTDEGDIYWFENVDSLANYFKPYLVAVAITPSDMSHVDLFDVDNDGDLDVVALDILNNKLYTYLNDLNATGKFLNFIFSDISYVGSNYLSRTDISDVNGDGKEDIIINGNTGLSWIKNLGNGLFDQPQTISTNIKTFDSIDFDNDGDIDFIQIESGSGADWLENDGVGNFIAHNIPNMVGRSILITDFDGDNFLDVLTTSYDTQSRIYWYEQVNDTVFTQQLLYSLFGSDFYPQGISMTASDQDGDFDNDILLRTDDLVLRFENLGGVVLSNPDTIYTSNGSSTSINNLVVADFNQDGYDDILTSIYYGGSSPQNLIIGWYANSITGSLSEYKYLKNTFPYTYHEDDSEFEIVDFDNDGDKDVLGLNVWLENNGDEVFRVKSYRNMSINDYVFSQGGKKRTSDVDMDGDLDLIYRSQNLGGFEWLENDGLNNFNTTHYYYHNINNLFDQIEIIDIDNDGDDDVVGINGVKAEVFENSNGVFSSLQLLFTGNSLSDLKLHDIDDDGDEDIFIRINTFGALEDYIWFENLGGGSFSSSNSINSQMNLFPMTKIKFLDVDSDSQKDMVILRNPDVVWAKNIGGTAFGPENVIYTANTNSPSRFDFVANDFNGDGLLDFMFKENFPGIGDSLIFLPNIGNGNFGQPQSFDSEGRIGRMYDRDMDGDGDIDLMVVGSAYLTKNNVSWYENTSNIYSCNSDANFSYTNNGNGNYSFSNGSIGNFSEYHWAFGDGVTSDLVTPNHTFATNGTYVVVLTVNDSVFSGSCFDYYTDTITVTGVASSLQCNAGFVMFPDTLIGNINVINSAVGNNLTYLWGFGDGSTSTLQNPSHTYATAGPFYLCLTVDDGSGCLDNYCDSIGENGVVFKAGGFTINVTTPVVVGLEEFEINGELMIYPNPTSNQLTITTNMKMDKISVLDITGKSIKSFIPTTNTINVEDLSDGIYFIKIEGENQSIIRKFVKQ